MSSDKIVKGNDRILYIEPNDLPAFMSATSSNGQTLDNISWDPEKLGIYVDLQVVIPSRQYDGNQNYDFYSMDDTKSWNKYESIFSGVRLTKDDRYLTADWTNVSYQEIKNNRAGSKEMLGINSINIIFDSHMYPVVTMNFTDVRGASLMMPQEQRYVDLNGGQVNRDEEVTKSFFSHIFRFPYPRFLLSVKGPYGTCVTFVLSVMDFKSTFNSESGNFDVMIKFIGNMYGLYTDIPMNYLIVAPYYGSPEGEYRLNNHWLSNDNFVFSDGSKICTFVEFYDAYMNNGGESTTIAENTMKTAENNADKILLEKILSEHYSSFETTVQNYGGSSTEKLFVNLDKTKVLFFNYDKNVTKEFDVSNFSSAVEEYKKQFPVDKGGFDFTKDYGPISDVYNQSSKRQTGDSSFTVNAFKKGVVTESGKTICEGLTLEESNKIRLEYKNYKNYNSAFVYPKAFELDIKNHISKLNSENNEMLEKVTSEVADHYTDVFGFPPTIENIMRMLFAHLDTFLYYFYTDCLAGIKPSRTLSTLGGFDKDLTDIESTSKGSAHVPPFTAFYRKIDGKCERMFPGDDGRLENISEVNFVNGILSAVGTTARRVADAEFSAEYGDDDKIEDGENPGSSNIDESAGIRFTPTCPYDMYYNGVNPYDYLNGNDGVYTLLNFFIYRMVLAYSCYGYSDKELSIAAKIDAENLKKSKNFSSFKSDKTKKPLNELKVKLDSPDAATEFFNFISNGETAFAAPYKCSGAEDSENIKIEKGWNAIPLGLQGSTKEKYNVKLNGSLSLCNILGEEYVKKFISKFPNELISTKYGSELVKNFNNFDYKTSFFFPRSKDLWGLNGGMPIVPIGYYKNEVKDGDVVSYLGVTNTTKPPKPLIEYTNDEYRVRIDNTMQRYESTLCKDVNCETRMTFGGDIGKFIETMETEYMWTPVVYGEALNRNGKKTSFNQMSETVTSDYHARAFLFLDGLLLGKDYVGEKRNRKQIYKSYVSLINEFSYYRNGDTSVFRYVKLSRAEYLFICGLCYILKNQTSIFDLIGVPLDIFDGFLIKDGDFLEPVDILSQVFQDWVQGEFKVAFTVPDTISGCYFIETENGEKKVHVMESRKKKISPYVLPNITGVTVQLELSNGETIDMTNEMVKRNELAVRLIKETVTTFFSPLVYFYCRTLPIGAIKKFVKDVCEYLGKESNGEDSGEVSAPEIVEGNFYESYDSSDMKNVVYYTLKNLYDRWLSMHTYKNFELYSPSKERAFKKARITNGNREKDDISEFSNFAYVDTFYNDISKKFLVNPATLFKLIGDQLDGTVSYNVLEFIGRICQDNKLLFRCLPVYSNIYNSSTFAEIFTPHSLYDGTSKTGRRIGNTYLIMYTYEPSHYLDVPQDQNDGVSYANDSFDIADTLGEITQEALEVMKKKSGNDEENYSICAFGVTPAKQNQSYFTKVSVGMESPRVTDFSIMNKFKLAQMSQRGGTSNIVGEGQNMYSIYSNRAYDCNVEMLGCANIMPMMYFQLNNVPMFKGAYMITKVEHNIQNNHMTTKFTGTRMPKRYIPFTKDAFMVGAIAAAINEAINWRVTGRWDRDQVDVKNAVAWKTKAAELGITADMHDNAAPRMMYERGMIVTVNDLMGYNKPVQIHAGLVSSLRRIFERIATETDFKITSVYGWRNYDSVTKGYASGGEIGNNTSTHCFGCAVDINGGRGGNPWFVHHIKRDEPEPAKGAMMPSGNKEGEGMKMYTPPSSGYDKTICTWHYDHPVVKIFEDEGWGWGGSYGDVMHFSVRGGK